MLEPTIEELFEEISYFTNDILRLNNNSKPKVYGREKDFFDAYVKIENIQISDDSAPRAIIDKDQVIHLNPSDKNWYVPIIAFFQPYSFFMEKTDLGKDLLKSNVDVLKDKKYSFLEGIGRWVELQTIEQMKNNGYNFDGIKSEMMNDIKSKPSYKAFQICDSFWNSREKMDLSILRGTKDPESNEIIAASILAASNQAMKDPSENFNKFFLELDKNVSSTKGAYFVDIYSLARLYTKKKEKILKQEEVMYLRECAGEIGILIATNESSAKMKISLQKLSRKLSDIESEYKTSNPFREIIPTSFSLYNGFKENTSNQVINDPEIFTLKQSLLDFFTDYVVRLNEYMKENGKING
jgi:hypothetical protein